MWPQPPTFVRNQYARGPVCRVYVTIVMVKDAPADLADERKRLGMIPRQLQFYRMAIRDVAFKHDGKAAAHEDDIAFDRQMQIRKMGFYVGFSLVVEFRILAVPQMRHASGSQGLEGAATDVARFRISTLAALSFFSQALVLDDGGRMRLEVIGVYD
jgi:hypothetical protein